MPDEEQWAELLAAWGGFGGQAGPGGPIWADFPSSRRISPSIIFFAPHRSRWYRWRGPRFIDQQQDFPKQVLRHRNLGHPERDVATMADDLGTDLDHP